ncbi:hypothetical protein BDZ94DRAFT_1314998 [Collybia nuda]|uniref:Uncharacterized protein n=1 Tax=Collybia nuda TaxID=64659 RepID=A0A9P6CD12_9AGAR|nr:hypothetical protein BDZ94DRAFT_1314998 [Collybia nuda]
MPATRTGIHSSSRRSSLTRKSLSKPPLSSQRSAKSRLSKCSEKSAALDRVYTDAILAIKPEFTDLIMARRKNHEYRSYKMRETVVRIWLYTTAPKSAITHVMVTALPKSPGEVCDSVGVGNDEFDNGLTTFKFGYPVLGLHSLEVPIKLDVMKKYGVLPPQGLVYAPMKLVDDFPLSEMKVIF